MRDSFWSVVGARIKIVIISAFPFSKGKFEDTKEVMKKL
jgi:hypothetical protein